MFIGNVTFLLAVYTVAHFFSFRTTALCKSGDNAVRSGTHKRSRHQDKSQGHNITLEASLKKRNKTIIYVKYKIDNATEKEKKIISETTKPESRKKAKKNRGNTTDQRPRDQANANICCQLRLPCCKKKPAQFDQYEASWQSLDRRSIPSWYEDAKFGVFIHWGVYSVPGFGNEWFWYHWKEHRNPSYVEFMQKNYRPGFSYADFAPEFTADLFDADKWAQLIGQSGAR